MRKLDWGAAMKKLPQTLLFSFGMAICLFMIVFVGSVVLTDGGGAFGPGEGRTVFTGSFLVALVFFLARSLRRGEKARKSK